MEFTTGITQFNTNYNLNAIDDYNKYLQGHASFEVEKTSFEEALDNATKSHPDADEEGYVDLPNINLVEEMVGMISASKAYEANATVAENVKTMMQTAMNI